MKRCSFFDSHDSTFLQVVCVLNIIKLRFPHIFAINIEELLKYIKLL